MKSKNFALLGAAVCGLIATSGAASGAIAMNPASAVNVALGRPTFGDTAFGAPTSRGNDGIDGNASSGNWTHADYPTSATPYPGDVGNAPNPYWEVDLEGSYALENIIITDRVGCCSPSRLDGSIITLFGAGGSVVGTQTLTGVLPSGGQTFTFDNGGFGFSGVERVRIDGVNGGTPIQYFQFSEFQATSLLATPVNWALGASAQYYDAAGSPVGSWPSLPASNITDGNLSSISHPDNPTPHVDYYVDVDLGVEVFIDSLDLTGRLDCCADRLEDYTIEFRDSSGALVHSMTHAGQTTATENIDVIGSFGGNGPQAQIVRIINSSGNNYGPQIGELQVYGVIPEPSVALLSFAGMALFFRRRRR